METIKISIPLAMAAVQSARNSNHTWNWVDELQKQVERQQPKLLCEVGSAYGTHYKWEDSGQDYKWEVQRRKEKNPDWKRINP